MQRRVLVHPDRVRAMFPKMRDELHDMYSKHLRELADLRRELDKARADLDKLRAAVRARQQAQDELSGLYRARAIQQAQAAERDPNAALN